MKRTVLAIVCATLLAFTLAGCGGLSSAESKAEPSAEPKSESAARSNAGPGDTTDEMYSESKSAVELEVFKQDGGVFTVDGHNEIPDLKGWDNLKDGRRYKLVADITYLNGGVAGYVDYPQIDRVISVEELPSAEL